jgi:hypothetical protein
MAQADKIAIDGIKAHLPNFCACRVAIMFSPPQKENKSILAFDRA